MADTHGFDIVAEVTPAMLVQVFQAAWKSGGNPGGGGVIPEYFDIPPGTMVGPYTLQDGQVQIPQNELDLTMAPDVNGVDLKFGLHFQVHIQNPPVPSLSMLTITADGHAKAPVGTLPNSVNVGILFAGLPQGNVTATLTSGDPSTPNNLDQYLAEYVHQQYQNDGAAFPHNVTQKDQPLGALGLTAYLADVYVDLFDDPTDVTHQIQVSRPPGQVKISIPIHMKIYNIRKTNSLAPDLQDPMGIEAQMVITATFIQSPGLIQAKLSTAMVTVENITPAPGLEGVNYTANNGALFGTLPTFISAQLQQQGQTMVQGMGDITIQFPTVAQIEAVIASALYQQLVAQGSLGVWTPQTQQGSPVQVNDVTTLATAQFLAIAINKTNAANIGAMGSFVPANRIFAIAISGPKVLAIINDSIHSPESQGGFGPNFPPKTFNNVDGHTAKLTRLDISLIAGAIHMDGDVTVVNAILGSIDVDTSFTEDTGLHWEDNPDGTQRIKSDPGQPNVDLSLLGWIISFIIGFITLGLIGGLVVLIVMLIVKGIAENIGSKLIVNNVTNQVEGIGAWPSELVKIGSVQSKFENPIDIEPDGMVMAG